MNKLAKKNALYFMNNMLVWGILFYLFTQANFMEGISGLAICLYFGLVYCQKKLIYISLPYVVACLVANFSILGIALAITPIIIAIAIRFVETRIDKKLNTYMANIAIGVSFLPTFVLQMQDLKTINCLLNYAICIGVGICAINFCYAIIVRKEYSKLTIDEYISGVVVLSMIFLGLWKIKWWNDILFYFVYGIIAMLSITRLAEKDLFILFLSIGLGISFGERNIEALGSIMVVYGTGVAFKGMNKWICGSAMIAINCLIGVVFHIFGQNNLWYLLAFGVGIILVLCIPDKWLQVLPSYQQTDGKMSAKSLLNNTKKIIAQRVGRLSKVFYSLADSYCQWTTTLPKKEQANFIIAQDIVKKTCQNCPKKQTCEKALGKPIEYYIESLVATAQIVGKATVADLPTTIATKCQKVPIMLSNCTSSIYEYNQKIGKAQQYGKDQEMMSKQFVAVGAILAKLEDEVGKTILVDSALEDNIIRELAYVNVVCSEVIVLPQNNGYNVSLVVRAKDKNEDIVKVVSNQLNCKMRLTCWSKIAESSAKNVILDNYPNYDITYGYRQETKKDSCANGDCIKTSRLLANKTLVALCDGMGSGQMAQDNSAQTLDMVVNFYKSGFDNPKALSLINKALVVNAQESFCAMDMCITDLDSGMCDFIKQGGVESYIRNQDGVEVVYAQALPIGIVEEATPQVVRKSLEVGDMVVLVSDGIKDCLSREGIEVLLDKIGSLNPQTVCDEIMRQAQAMGLDDDASIVAFRLFAN